MKWPSRRLFALVTASVGVFERVPDGEMGNGEGLLPMSKCGADIACEERSLASPASTCIAHTVMIKSLPLAFA